MVGVIKLVIFVAVINVWPLNGLKLQPIQSLAPVVYSSASSPPPLTPLPTPLMTKPKRLLPLVGT